MDLSTRMCFFLFLITVIGYCTSTNEDVLREKIVIIGAGASGIAAASKLLEHGYQNIVVLEANNRIGGRIWTKYDDDDTDIFFELGAQLIMGESGNVAYELAKEAGIIGYKLDELEGIYVKSNGENIPPQKILQLLSSYNEIISTFDNKTKLISELFKEQIENLVTSDLDKDTITKFFKLLIESITPVTDWEHDTGSGLRTFVPIEGSTAITLKTSVSSLLHILMKSYPASTLSPKWQKIIQLGSEVKSIHWNQPKPTIKYAKSTDSETLIDIEAEHIIVTIPLGVLKHDYKTLFVPSLLERKVNAIRSLAFGTVNKVFLRYEDQWWRDNKIFFVIWNEVDTQNLKFFSEIRQMAGKYCNIVTLTVEPHYPGVITAWFVEKDSVTTEDYSCEEVSTKLASFIKKAFGNQGWNITDVENSKCTRWQENTYFRGAYSYRGLDASNNHITNADLRESLKNENGKETVLFAGEATHDKYYSTLHGAIETGYTAANKIVDIHKFV